MSKDLSYLRAALLSGALAGSCFVCGCAVQARYYDAPHADYHVWGTAEVGPYSRWEVEYKRPHVEYRKLKPEDRQAYWNWRHDHP